jgi:hypothetical protein
MAVSSSYGGDFKVSLEHKNFNFLVLCFSWNLHFLLDASGLDLQQGDSAGGW